MRKALLDAAFGEVPFFSSGFAQTGQRGEYRGILQVAKHFVRGENLTRGMLNRVEALIRTYDPCLSCSTHALGQMPLVIQLFNASGEMVDEIRRPD